MIGLRTILLVTVLAMAACTTLPPNEREFARYRMKCGGNSVMICNQGAQTICRCGPLTSIN